MKQRKKIIRKNVLESLRSMDKTTYEQLSRKIAENLFKEDFFKEAKKIAITVSNFPEVDTFPIIRACWEHGKIVCVPKCLPLTKEMVFRKLEDFDQLEMVYHNLYEPIEERTERVDKTEMDLMIVPGLAYTINGYRLGFGGGYYDRFLKGYKGSTVSLAFIEQIVDQLPIEAHDKPVQKIITNEGVI